MKIKLFISLVCIVSGVLFASCRSNNNVIILEERDPIIKRLYEKDSLVVYPRDTLKKNK